MATVNTDAALDLEVQLKFLDKKMLRLGWVSKPDRSNVNKRTMDAKMLNDKKVATPMTVGAVARIHELGRGSNPKRSMLKATLKRRRPEVRSLYRRATAAVMAGKISGGQALGLIGEGVLSQIKDRMRKGISPPLSEETKRRKRNLTVAGSSKDTALIKWGILINSVRYKIVTRKG